jgi:hypothetical protein
MREKQTAFATRFGIVQIKTSSTIEKMELKSCQRGGAAPAGGVTH